MKVKIKNICCIGGGYVGGPTMSVIADKCNHIQVNVVDVNLKRINLWNSNNLDNLPIYEPGLKEIVERRRGKNLFFSSDLEKHISCADMIFISVNTPTKIRGEGAGKASDLKWVEASARKVAEFARGHTIVVEKSTLPVRTANVIKEILEAAQSSSSSKNPATFDVLSNPEFLAEGSAVKDLEQPDRVLIGGENENAIFALNDIYKNWVPQQKILHTNIWSSELAKLTANAFLAQRISSINSIGALCEATGADVREVARAIGSDSRIGSKFLDSGPGFGGSCFKKDILNLVYLSNHFGLEEVARFWEGVVELNTWHQKRISRLVVSKLYGTVRGKKIGILGFSFKANTNDTRESSAISICKDLLEEGALLHIHDPRVDLNQIEIDLKLNEHSFSKKDENDNHNLEEGVWIYSNTIEEVFKSADAVLILTEWNEYSLIDWKSVSTKMRKPSWIFDARSVLNLADLKGTDLNFWRIGDGSLIN